VIVANTLAYLIARKLQPVPIFDILTRQDGLHLPSMEEQREERILRVEDAMRPADVPVLGAEKSAKAGWHETEEYTGQALLVREPSRDWRLLTKQELQRLIGEGKGDEALGLLLRNGQVPHLHPDQPLDHALRYAYDCPLLPVVHRADFQQLVGILSLDDIARAYRSFNKDQ
jgi:chloride channel protein, CIC family